MNDLLYELMDVRLLADRGTLVPVRITAETPLMLIAEEAVTVSASSMVYHVGKKQFLLLLEKQDVVEIAPNSGDKLGNVHGIYFRSYRLARREKENLHYEASAEHLPEHGHVQNISRRASDRLLELLELAGSPRNALNSPKAGLMLHRLMEMFFSRELPQPDFMTRNGAIKRAVAFIDSRYAEPLTRDMAAQLSGFNESYFSSLFRKETGWSFGEYLNRVRIDEAKRRLLGTSEKIGDIAYQTGFADASYFGKAFQKIVGMSPGSFRTLAGSKRVASMQFYGAMLLRRRRISRRGNHLYASWLEPSSEAEGREDWQGAISSNLLRGCRRICGRLHFPGPRRHDLRGLGRRRRRVEFA